MSEKMTFEDFVADTLPPRTEPEPKSDCANPYCLDGYADHARGNQDGTESWVEQVPCQLCNADEDDGEVRP